jgi:hypothetical protein
MSTDRPQVNAPMAREEIERFLTQPLVGILSWTTLKGAVASSPVWHEYDRIDGESDLGTFGPKLVHALSSAKNDVDAARGMCASAQLKSARRRLKTAVRDMIQYAHHLRTLAARKRLPAALRNALLAAGDPIGRDLGILKRRLQCPSQAEPGATRVRKLAGRAARRFAKGATIAAHPAAQGELGPACAGALGALLEEGSRRASAFRATVP